MLLPSLWRAASSCDLAHMLLFLPAANCPPRQLQLNLHVIEAENGQAGLAAYLQAGRTIAMVFMVRASMGRAAATGHGRSFGVAVAECEACQPCMAAVAAAAAAYRYSPLALVPACGSRLAAALAHQPPAVTVRCLTNRCLTNR